MDYCKWHKQYKGKRKPRCNCTTCWKIFINKNPDYEFKSEEIKRILLAILCELDDHDESIDNLKPIDPVCGY